MLSISYITGQMNAPISQFLGFFQNAQDAKISLERLSEIHNREEEEAEDEIEPDDAPTAPAQNNDAGIVIKELSFRYAGPGSPLVLDNINMVIPFGKVTAIVGSSGSGKTTLMKMLLKFYEPEKREYRYRKEPFTKDQGQMVAETMRSSHV